MKQISDDFWIKDPSLWEEGREKILLTLSDMPGLKRIETLYAEKQPFKGARITGCVTVTYETANFILLLHKLGAELRWCSDNRFSTKDDAASYLVHCGIAVFAKSNETEEEFEWCMEQALSFPGENDNIYYPDLIIDDGADITQYIYKSSKFNLLENLQIISEQTTCGMNFVFNQLAKDQLFCGIVNVNDSIIKLKFDNHYGIKESLIAGIYNAGYTQVSGKRVVIAGYGEVGQGAAFALAGIGAKICITEIDPIKLAKAHLDGFEIASMEEAVLFGEMFITATGCQNVIRKEHIVQMKSGSFLINIGHGNQEIEVDFLEEEPTIHKVRNSEYCDTYIFEDGKQIRLLCGGYLVNIRAAKGNTPRVMSLTFTSHILALLDVWRNPDNYNENIVYSLTREMNENCAMLNFPEIVNKLTHLTPFQEQYLGVNLHRSSI